MPEPTSAATATLAAGAALGIPLVTLFGISLGLRADVLLAGFAGSISAMALLNTVPATGDTVRELVRTSARRVCVAIGSAFFAGYAAPLLALVNGVPQPLMLSVAFVAGAGAQSLLAALVRKSRESVERKGGDQ